MTWLLLVPECYFRCYHLYPHPGFCFLLWVHIDSLNQGVYVSQFGLPTYRQCKRINFYFEIFILKLSLVNQIIANKKLIKSKRKKNISIHELGQESLSLSLCFLTKKQSATTKKQSTTVLPYYLTILQDNIRITCVIHIQHVIDWHSFIIWT